MTQMILHNDTDTQTPIGEVNGHVPIILAIFLVVGLSIVYVLYQYFVSQLLILLHFLFCSHLETLQPLE
jgi:hypothetical protein